MKQIRNAFQSKKRMLFKEVKKVSKPNLNFYNSKHIFLAIQQSHKSRSSPQKTTIWCRTTKKGDSNSFYITLSQASSFFGLKNISNTKEYSQSKGRKSWVGTMAIFANFCPKFWFQFWLYQALFVVQILKKMRAKEYVANQARI